MGKGCKTYGATSQFVHDFGGTGSPTCGTSAYCKYSKHLTVQGGPMCKDPDSPDVVLGVEHHLKNTTHLREDGCEAECREACPNPPNCTDPPVTRCCTKEEFKQKAAAAWGPVSRAGVHNKNTGQDMFPQDPLYTKGMSNNPCAPPPQPHSPPAPFGELPSDAHRLRPGTTIGSAASTRARLRAGRSLPPAARTRTRLTRSTASRAQQTSPCRRTTPSSPMRTGSRR